MVSTQRITINHPQEAGHGLIVSRISNLTDYTGIKIGLQFYLTHTPILILILPWHWMALHYDS